MKILTTNLVSIVALAIALGSCGSKPETVSTMKDHYKNDFLIGAAVPMTQVNGELPKADSVFSLHFNSIVAENCMKSEEIHPEEGVWFWDDADKFMDYAEQRNMAVIGHTLIWHSQLAPWFAVDSLGNDVSADELKKRMKEHITTIMTRYKGRVKGWDVVNEAIVDDGSYRQSPFYRILGEEFIPLAFEYAHEADPDAELYINDYGMAIPAKREAYVKLVKNLKDTGHRIDAIGMQSHNGMDYPNFEEFEKSLVAFSETGANVMITELDMSALPTLIKSANISDTADSDGRNDPYPNGLPEDVSKQWNDRMSEFMDMIKKHSDVVTRVTTWGVGDGNSWKNDFPVKGRTDYPLFFDRNYDMKPFMNKELTKQMSTMNKKVEKRYLWPADYMADPSVHVFNGKIYVYPSHDIEVGNVENDNGDQYVMRDMHVLSIDGDPMTGKVNDNGVALDIANIPWAGRQLWDCDCAEKDGKYYLYFPLKDKNDIFRIGVAIADRPEGPFIPQPDPIRGSYSIDICVFEENGEYYLYFGGIWGGQLQRYSDNKALEIPYLPEGDQTALPSRVVRLTDDMLQFAEEPRPVLVVDEEGNPLKADDPHRFFEASWLHKHDGKYYFSYSTGDTHMLCYAVGDNPYGPFTYKGVILTPVVGWTTHHSIIEYEGKTYLFHHDSVPSGGKSWLRSLKVCELTYNPDGTIQTIEGTDE